MDINCGNPYGLNHLYPAHWHKENRHFGLYAELITPNHQRALKNRGFAGENK